MLTKSSTEIVRHQNSALLLATLRRHGSLSHTDLADRSGLSSATVSAITADLERERIIEKMEAPQATGRGRPRVLFRPRRDSAYFVTIKISSDLVQYSLVDYRGTLLDRFEEERHVASETSAGFSASLLAATERLASRSQLSTRSILAISVSSKGLVDASAPRLVWSPVFGSQQIDFEAVFASMDHAKILLSNETLLVATAIWRRLEASGSSLPRSLAALSLGHSIGLGIVSTDASGLTHVTAPDFGHMLHAGNGALCRCGSMGCIEASAGFYAILRTAFEVPPDKIPAKFVPTSEMDKIAANARRGDRMAAYAFRQAGIALGNGLSRMLSLHETMPIHVTGLGIRYYDLLEKGLKEGLSQSRLVKLEGLPEISVVADEAALVFEGHMDLSLNHLDHEIVLSRHAVADT